MLPNAPTLCYVHGFLGSSRWFYALAEHLPEWNHILIDLPGHGASAPFASQTDLSFVEVLEALELVISSYKDSHPLFLYGYSMGARLALQFYFRFPNVVNALILESGTAGVFSPHEGVQRMADDAKKAAFLTENPAQFFGMWNSNSLFTNSASHPEVLRAQQEAHPEICSRWLTEFSTGSMTNQWENLNSITIPTLLIAGSNDQKFVGIAERMRAKIPSSYFARIEAAGHRPHLEQPEETASAVRSFLTSHSEFSI